MEDDQEAQYESPYSNISPWEDQGSLAAGDTNSNNNSNRNTNQGDDGSGELCIKIKGTSGAAHDNNEHHPRLCHICNKGFSSGKALGGHMRMHALSSKQAQNKAKEGSHVSKPNNSNTWVLVGGRNPTCYLCTKSFPSMKSLFGHMRSHPERVWRGIQPPSSTTPNEVASSNSTSSSTLSDDSAVDLSRALWGWSVTAKRGRKSLSCCNTDSGLKYEVEVEQRMQEAVYELMLLAHGDPKTVLECEDTSKRKKKLAGDDQVELSSVSLKIEEKSLNKMGYEEEDSDSESDSQNSDGSTVGTDMKNGNKNSNKKKKGTKKMKLNEIGTAEQGNKLDNGTANRYRCSICNKSFPSHQALGGHLSSHKKSKNIQITDESESDDLLAAEDEEEEHHAKTTSMQGDETETVVEGLLGCSSTMEIMSGHQCNICNKTFSTGQGCQALGGHKRSHWTVIAEAQSAQATSPVENGQNRPKVLSFDLNQLPAMDEEEGVQSDLFFPTNVVASSPYASFSQNLVTN